MALFKKAPQVGADGYERKMVRGYAHRGKVAQMLGAGWEIENVQQVQINGTTMKQARYLLKRKVG